MGGPEVPLCCGLPHPRQPPTVARLSPVSGPCPTGVTDHADCLPDISPQDYTVEDGYQGAESIELKISSSNLQKIRRIFISSTGLSTRRFLTEIL